MSATDLPKEALEALRDLAANGADADVSPPMLKVLEEQGYAELTDGQWAVTETGQSLLDLDPQGLPRVLPKAD